LKNKRKLTAIMLSIIITCYLGLSNPVYAITNGTPDTAHKWVCLVVLFDEAGDPISYLTGTFLSPTIVLTAGHGTSIATTVEVYLDPDVDPWAVPPYTHWDGVPYTNPDFSYSNPNAPGNFKGIPSFDYHDVGIVVLDEPGVTMRSYGVLPTVGQVEALPAGTKFDLVGYGAQFQFKDGTSPHKAWAHLWQRMYAPAKLVSGSFAWSSEFLRSSANPGQGKGGISFGDSGGPVFLAGTNIILAVNSYMTNNNSGGVSYHQRIDIADILAWITSYLEPS
jgi:hypothetical protein